MKVTAISAHVVKAPKGYTPVNTGRSGEDLPGTDYFRIAPYPHVFARQVESVIVQVETDAGITGWGESHAPIAAAVAANAIVHAVGPVVLGRDPSDVAVLYSEMLGTAKARGHDGGYQSDAIAGIDTALWDINGKVAGKPVSSLLGGRFRDVLPAYSSGLRGQTLDDRLEEARGRIADGLGVKAFVGANWKEEAAEMAALREAVGDQAALYADALCSYRPSEAAYLGEALQDNGFEFFEAPVAHDDIRGHERVAANLAIPIAVGEMLRTRKEFLPWMESGAIGVYQPDLMHIGVTETRDIATVAETFEIPVGLHVGQSTVVGMAATWQVASTLPNFLVQEHQPVMFETFNKWLREPLVIQDGCAVVPLGPGLGIDIDEEMLQRDVVSTMTITLD